MTTNSSRPACRGYGDAKEMRKKKRKKISPAKDNGAYARRSTRAHRERCPTRFFHTEKNITTATAVNFVEIIKHKGRAE